MVYDQEIPYTSEDNVNYLIRFSAFPADKLPEGINLPVVDIVIETDADFKVISNSRASLSKMVNIILDYADKNNVVLYCYCSDKAIKKSKNNEEQTNQQFRSNLFSAMFKMNKSEKFLNKVVVIHDLNAGHHYLHLITKVENKHVIDEISIQLSKLDK